MLSGISRMRESSIRTMKSSMIRFVGGSMTIWRRRRALRLPSPRFIARRAKQFRGSKTAQLSTLRELVAILETHGVPVRMLKAQRVGYVVYEDEHQVVAEPFADMTC